VTQDVPLGSPATVDLVISELGEYTSPSLGAFDLYVDFNPAVLRFSFYEMGPFLGNISSGEAQDLSLLQSYPGWYLGQVNFAELSLLSADELNNLQPSNFTIATITFDTIALGSSYLYLWYNTGGIGDENGDPLDVYLRPGNVNVTSVPEPATILLISVGLAGLGGVRYFKSKKLLKKS